jgi:hypothetical protein
MGRRKIISPATSDDRRRQLDEVRPELLAQLQRGRFCDSLVTMILSSHAEVMEQRNPKPRSVDSDHYFRVLYDQSGWSYATIAKKDPLARAEMMDPDNVRKAVYRDRARGKI